jgi:hypothetical protein
MGPRLVGLAAILARRQGAAAAQALLRKGSAWMADPANDGARQALVEQLRAGAEKAGGTAARLGGRLAREIERRTVSVAAWERDLMSLRYEVADMAPGPVREAAIDAYVAQVSAAVHLISGGTNPTRARVEVMRALAAEERMLASERLGADERRRALAAVAAARAACAER